MYLAHYGTPHHSGRYPFGSGKRPFQRNGGGRSKKESAKERLSKMDDNTLAAYTKRRENENKYKAGEAVKYDQASKAFKAGSEGSRAASRAVSKSAERKRNKIIARDFDVSKMSDQDLQKKVNRMNLERNYRNLKSDQISLGRDRAADYLDTAGDILAVGASAAQIAMAIYFIKNMAG